MPFHHPGDGPKQRNVRSVVAKRVRRLLTLGVLVVGIVLFRSKKLSESEAALFTESRRD